MTQDATVAFSDEQGEGTKPRRGRPRPQTTIQRDEQVFAVMTSDGATSAEIAEATGLPKKQVYASLCRLRWSDKVYRVHERGAHIWKLR